MRRITLALGCLLIATSYALAADPHATAPATSHAAPGAVAPAHNRPVLPEPTPMPGVAIMIILALFLLAAVIGPIVRYHAPEEVPEAASHDEHGHGGHGAHDAHHGHHH